MDDNLNNIKTDIEKQFVADPLVLGSVSLGSRMIVGTGKYPSLELMQKCHEESQAQMVTVALRRVPLKTENQNNNILDYINQKNITLLPNTAGAHSAQEALRLAKLAKAMGMTHLKIEVMGDVKTLLPDPVETLKAVELIREKMGDDLFLMVYTSMDSVLAVKLINAGAGAVMPAGSPIGSGRGIENPFGLKLLLEMVENKVPVILDAGIGSPSDAVLAMEMGADAILLNSAIALSSDPIKMAQAMHLAWMSGRLSYLAGRIEKKMYATASSPVLDF